MIMTRRRRRRRHDSRASRVHYSSLCFYLSIYFQVNDSILSLWHTLLLLGQVSSERYARVKLVMKKEKLIKHFERKKGGENNFIIRKLQKKR
tara:strand:- start:71 stop:346 length:276 start_codon:yes stop_codon:yes gene_type:complete